MKIDNIVEALSRVGMNLEKRLAYIYTKNKAIKDENILMRCVYNQQYRDMDLFSTSPPFLGLKQPDISSDSESNDGSSRKIPKDVSMRLDEKYY